MTDRYSRDYHPTVYQAQRGRRDDVECNHESTRPRSLSTDRPVKSYLERYHDIKSMTLSSGAVGASSLRSADRTRVTNTADSLAAKYSSDPIATILTDDESSKTLERWESRKERKRAQDSSRRWTTTTGADRGVEPASGVGGVTNRWSPRYDYDSPELNERKVVSDHNSSSNDDEGNGSPLFNDVELDDRPNIGVDHNSPLAIDHHFDRTDTQSRLQESQQPQPQPRRSNYVESLRSFSDAISEAVKRDYVSTRQPPQTHHSNNNEEAYHPPDPIPSVSFYDENKQDPEEEDQKYIGRRIRMGAAAGCCRRFPCKGSVHDENANGDGVWKEQNNDDVYPSSHPVSASNGRSQLHIYAALVVCIACVIATTVTIKHFSYEKGASYAMSGGTVTLRPTISSMPSSPPSDHPSGMPSEPPTNRPTSERERLISEYLSEITEGVSNVDGSPQYRAKMWILFEDGLNLRLPSIASEELKKAVMERIQQRYALATLYYALGIGEGGVLKGWLEGDECKFVGDFDEAWDGVGCDENGEVRALAIDGANLSGTIPSQISLLHKMENLIIKNNPYLQGKIPNSIGGMSQLRQIGLYGNALTGTLPQTVLQLPELVYLNVADNTLMGEVNWEGIGSQTKLDRLILQNNFFEGPILFRLLSGTKLTLLGLSNNNFRGMVDSSMGSMTSLEYLYLDRNKLVGTLPDSLGNLTSLVSLNLDENEFDGTLPSTIGQLSRLNYLSARGNKLSGSLPSGVRSLSNLKTLNLANNALSGSIRTLIEMPSLEHVHLYQNSFTGAIPSSLFAARNLKVLFLSSNSLSGNIPAEVSSARSLKGLYLSDNMLQGNIPNSACSLTNLEDLFLDENAFSGQLPGCLGNLSKLRRLYVFKNNLTGNVPSAILNLPNIGVY
eukprot:CCRYP_000980-RA/>CCRYP_000980-RA protein AED:0.02 eAED:0.02 QI:317/1/1/1/1/1/3/413/895